MTCPFQADESQISARKINLMHLLDMNYDILTRAMGFKNDLELI